MPNRQKKPHYNWPVPSKGSLEEFQNGFSKQVYDTRFFLLKRPVACITAAAVKLITRLNVRIVNADSVDLPVPEQGASQPVIFNEDTQPIPSSPVESAVQSLNFEDFTQNAESQPPFEPMPELEPEPEQEPEPEPEYTPTHSSSVAKTKRRASALPVRDFQREEKSVAKLCEKYDTVAELLGAGHSRQEFLLSSLQTAPYLLIFVVTNDLTNIIFFGEYEIDSGFYLSADVFGRCWLRVTDLRKYNAIVLNELSWPVKTGYYYLGTRLNGKGLFIGPRAVRFQSLGMSGGGFSGRRPYSMQYSEIAPECFRPALGEVVFQFDQMKDVIVSSARCGILNLAQRGDVFSDVMTGRKVDEFLTSTHAEVDMMTSNRSLAHAAGQLDISAFMLWQCIPLHAYDKPFASLDKLDAASLWFFKKTMARTADFLKRGKFSESFFMPSCVRQSIREMSLFRAPIASPVRETSMVNEIWANLKIMAYGDIELAPLLWILKDKPLNLSKMWYVKWPSAIARACLFPADMIALEARLKQYALSDSRLAPILFYCAFLVYKWAVSVNVFSPLSRLCLLNCIAQLGEIAGLGCIFEEAPADVAQLRDQCAKNLLKVDEWKLVSVVATYYLHILLRKVDRSVIEENGFFSVDEKMHISLMTIDETLFYLANLSPEFIAVEDSTLESPAKRRKIH